MQLADGNVWEARRDRAAALAVARRAVELGATFVDTADSYALGANEELLTEALHPYTEVLIATKAGRSCPEPDVRSAPALPHPG